MIANNTSHASSVVRTQRPHLDYLDGARGLAALYVVLFHAWLMVFWTGNGGLPDWAVPLTYWLKHGRYAVSIFIVLSGYCLMLPVARQSSFALAGGMGRFIKRRAWRILPPYYAALVISLIVLAITKSDPAASEGWWSHMRPGAFQPGTILSHLFLFHNLSNDWLLKINTPLWSVATEWQIYFVFPLVLLPILRRLGMTAMVVCAFVLGLTPLALLHSLDGAAPWYIGLFAFGVAAAVISASSDARFVRMRNGVPWAIIAATFAAGLSAYESFPRIFAGWHEWKHLLVGDLFTGIATSALLIGCFPSAAVNNMKRMPLLTRVLSARPIVTLGRFSYSLYLTHAMILLLTQLAIVHMAFDEAAQNMMLVGFGIPLSLAAAYAFYCLFERPVFSLRDGNTRRGRVQSLDGRPTLCMIFEIVGQQSAIAKIALFEVKTALAAGFHVTVVAKEVDSSVCDRVEWLPLYVPPKLFALKWLTARFFIKRALGGRTFNVIHAHQPQAASLADVFQCHFLTRAAYQRKCLETRTSLRARFIRAQQQLVLYAEDFFYRHWNSNTHMIFCSAYLQSEFHRLYGVLPSEEVLTNPCPPLRIAGDAERRSARESFVGPDESRIIVGYLGGLQERKGYKRFLAALGNDPDLFALFAGSFTKGFSEPALAGGMISLGEFEDTPRFYAACDVLLVPSYFDPCPVVVFEAATRGTPVIATEDVGNLADLLRFNAGEAWDGTAPLGPIIRRIMANHAFYRRGILAMAEALSSESYGERLIARYHQVLRQKGYVATSVEMSPTPALALAV